jgi:hypothetical protein
VREAFRKISLTLPSPAQRERGSSKKRYATAFMTLLANRISAGTGSGNVCAPAASAFSAWRASSSFMRDTIARLRASFSGSLSRCSPRCAST